MGDFSEAEDYDYDYDSSSQRSHDYVPRVLVVGEKPAVARSLKRALQGRPFLDFQEVEWIFTSTRGHVSDIRFPKGSLPVWNHRALCYHVAHQAKCFENDLEVFSKDEELQGHWRWAKGYWNWAEDNWHWVEGNWQWVVPDHVEDTLISHCKSIDFLLLCLDNDLEGESIAAEVESLLVSRLEPPRFGIEQQIWRCTFSSLDRDSLRRAVALPPCGTLKDINRDFVEAVQVRRELDLRLGFAFSRAQKHLVWNFLQNQDTTDADKDIILRVCQGFGDQDDVQSGRDGLRMEYSGNADRHDPGSEAEEEGQEDEEGDPLAKVFDPKQWPVLSYGPCQLPTLGFVVKNDVDISSKLVQTFWKIKAQCKAGTHELVAWSEPFHEEHSAKEQALQIEAATAKMPAASHMRALAAGPKLVVSLEQKKVPGYQRPKALCTTRMLQLASDCLGLSPARALDLAQDLYEEEFISYPRSETDSYDLESDLEAIAMSIGLDPNVSDDVNRYAQILVNEGLAAPRQDARDAGDHIPIMPVAAVGRAARRAPRGEAADLYDLILRVFLASVSPDAVLEQTTLIIEVPFGGCSLRATGQRVQSLGWIEVLPIMDAEDSPLPDSARQAAMVGSSLVIEGVSVERFSSESPQRLTEAALLASMEAHGIGTDASMPGHIDKIIQRCYAKVNVADCRSHPKGKTARFVPEHWFSTVRTLHPTHQGSALFRWFMLFGKELALPSVRADVEAAYLEVSRGQREGGEVLETFIEKFWWQFWELFDSQSQTSQKAYCTLISFLKQSTDANRQNRSTGRGHLASDNIWKKAERLISSTRLQEMAESRAEQMDGVDTQSAPATAAINHCLMIEAEIINSEGELTSARDLHVGDPLAAVFVQNGQLTRGLCSVASLKCYRNRERDVASLNLRKVSVQTTSNHSFMAKRVSEVLPWGPVVVRDLSRSYSVVVDDWTLHASHTSRDTLLANTPGQSAVCSVHIDRQDIQVIELELECGEAACWLLTSPAGLVAVYGEVPRILPFHRRHVAIWGFSRCPPEFRQALRESDALEACREALLQADFSFILPSGGHMFVRAEDAKLVKHALEFKRILPRASEVVVSPEFETRLEEALGLIRSTRSVYRKRNQELHLDTAMADIAAYRNGRHFEYASGGRFVQGRKTFIDLEEAMNEESMARSAATW